MYKLILEDRTPDWFNENSDLWKHAVDIGMENKLLPITKLKSKSNGYYITWYNTENHNIFEKLIRTKFQFQTEFDLYIDNIIKLIKDRKNVNLH